MGNLARGPKEKLQHWTNEEPHLDDDTSQFDSSEYGVEENTEQAKEESSVAQSASSSKKGIKRKKKH